MYRLNEEKMFFDVSDGQAVVINYVTGMYYGTSDLGSVILERLIAGHPTDAILGAVKAIPGCPEDMDARLADFIGALVKAEILIPGDTVPGGEEAIDPAAAENGFDLTVDEFAEVQDLLLADPIHDVDVEKGWPVFDKGADGQ